MERTSRIRNSPRRYVPRDPRGSGRAEPSKPGPPSRRGGGRRAASKHAQSKKKGLQQHQGLESLYIHKRVKAPGGTLKTSEFGTVLGYDATRGWRVVYDKKRGRYLPKTREIYVKDRAELVPAGRTVIAANPVVSSIHMISDIFCRHRNAKKLVCLRVKSNPSKPAAAMN